jgi:Protein of unknown function (DUF1176)
MLNEGVVVVGLSKIHALGRGVLAAAILPMMVGLVQADTGHYAQFQTWVVGCDNVRTCKAIGFQGEEGNALIVDRTGDGAARPVFRLRMVKPEAVKTPVGKSLEFVADGVSIGLMDVGQSFETNSDQDHWNGDVVGAAVEAGLLKALRTARELVVRQPNGEPIVKLPLEGASAALLMMDDLQHRIGTQGALVRPGSQPDSAVPPPPPLPLGPVTPPIDKHPAASAVPPAAVQRLYDEDRRKDVCDKGLAKTSRERVTARLGPKLVLYTLPCWMGAYQGTDAYYFYHEGGPGRAERAALPHPVFGKIANDEEPAQPTHVVGDEGFDPATGIISEYNKGRGLGDCGSMTHWQWDGSRFLLTGFTTMPICRGLGMDDWFDIARSREK